VKTINFKNAAEKPQLQFVRILAQIYFHLKTTLNTEIDRPVPNTESGLLQFTPGKDTYGYNDKEKKSSTKSSRSTSSQANNNSDDKKESKKTRQKPLHQQLQMAQVIRNINNNNEYRIIMVMGISPTSTIFAAFDSNNTYVAVKFVATTCPTDACLPSMGPPPEVAVLQNLSHSNVMSHIDWWWTSSSSLFKEKESERENDDDIIYYVIVSPLYKKIPYHFNPSYVATSRMRDLLEAVRYLHNNGVYHGDIKPSNIMFTRDKQRKIVLIDFDGSRSSDNSHNVDTAKYVTHKYGTPGNRTRFLKIL